MDAFWDTLLKVDGTTGSAATGLSSDVVQEEGKSPEEVNLACPTVVPDAAAQSSTAPTPPQKINVTHNILDSVNQASNARIAVAHAWVDEGLYARDQYIFLATDPRRLMGAMMVNATEKLHQENGELLKLADTHRKTISTLSVEVEEEKRKREKEKEKTRNMKKWEDRIKEEGKQKRKLLHDEITTLKKNQELGRSTFQPLQDEMVDLQRDLQAKIDAESRAVQELTKE
ncbi:hypothetical protein Dimus_015985 [Dionaea muscipula]